MCGAAKRDPREYMTEAQAERENRREMKELYKDDDWTFPNYGEE
jgi:hypothetical protein